MSFSQDLKQQITGIIGEEESEKKAELLSFFYMKGEYERPNLVTFYTDNPGVSRKLITLLKNFFPEKYAFKVQYKGQFKKAFYRVAVYVPDEKFFNYNYIFSDLNDKKAFLRGAFLSRGSITNPKKGYYLEFRCPTFPVFIMLKEQLVAFKIESKGITRKNNYFLYVKNGEMISDFLKVIGAYSGMFVFEETRVIKEMKNIANRRNNLDLANLDKTIEASGRQVRAIEIVKARIGLENMPANLRAIAYLRLENPYLPLAELGELVTPKLKKSAVNYRLKKIEELAEEL